MKIAILSQKASLYSTTRLREAGEQRGHEVHVVNYLRCYMNITSHKPMVIYQGKTLEGFDAIIPRIGASKTFYGTAVVRQFEMMGVFPANESQAITRSRDKLRCLQLLARQGIGLPVTGFANFGEEGDFAEKGGVLTRGFGLAAAMAENFDAIPVGGGEVAHVFHQAQNGYIHFLKHGNTLADDTEGSFLRRTDDDATVKRLGLAERELGIAGAGRQIHKEIIQIRPFHGQEKLVDGLGDHGSAPDDGLVILQQEANAHDFHAVGDGGHQTFVRAY